MLLRAHLMPPSALSQVETTCLVCQPVVRDDWSAADLAETREGRRRLTISLVRIHLHRVRVSDRDVERPRAQDSSQPPTISLLT